MPVFGYTLNVYDRPSDTKRRNNLGLNFGVTVGFNLFDGNRRREIRNARIAIENAERNKKSLPSLYAPTSAICGRHTKITSKY